ncbi:MAG: AAA family ATPase [Actinomycetota bacterium]|nr:AAA family ATPase [Actinomycetota bacterium]
MFESLPQALGVQIDERTEILGITIQGPDPIGVVHLPWRTGLTALYGRNGAGKSMLLRSIESAFSGVLPDIRVPLPGDSFAFGRNARVFLHLRIIDPHSPLERKGTLAGEVLEIVDEAVDALVGGYRTLGNPIGDLTEREIEELEYRARGAVDTDRSWAGTPAASIEIVARAHAYLARQWGLPRRSGEPVDRGDAIREIASRSVVSLRVVGSTQPEWEVNIAAVPDDAAPLFTREVTDWLCLHQFHKRWTTSMSPVDRLTLALLAARQSYETDPGPAERAEFDRLAGSVETPDLAIALEGLRHAWNGSQDFFVENEYPDELTLFRELVDAVSGDTWWENLKPDEALAAIPAVDGSLWWYLFGEPFGNQLVAEAVREGLGEPPVGLPIPLGGVVSGVVRQIPRVVTFQGNNATALARSTAYAIAPYLDPDYSQTGPSSEIDWLINRWPTTLEAFVQGAEAELLEAEVNANTFLRTVWPELPEVRVRIGDLRDWTGGRPVSWEAKDRPTGRWVQFDQLSTAQGRWVNLAVETALAGMRHQHSAELPPVIIVDEPELALHSRSSREVADGLVQLASEYNCPVVVASHSPAFLGRQDAVLLHVQRDSSGRVEIKPLETGRGGELDRLANELGLERSEFLQLVDVFLMVEGEHDRIVFDGLVGDELARLNARVIPMRGSDNLRGLIDAEMVFEFTDASVVVILDHIGDPDSVIQAWEKAVQLAEKGNVIAARKIFSAGVGRGPALNKEEGQLIQFASRVLGDPEKRGRILVTGVTRPGIEMYLPLTELGGSASAKWESLDAEYLRGSRSLDWKAWLKREHSVVVDSESVAAATQTMDDVPTDITSLLDVVEQARLRRQLNRE